MARERKDYSQYFINDFRGVSTKSVRAAYNKLIKVANERIKVITKQENVGHAHAYSNYVEPMMGAQFVKTNAQGNVIFKSPGRGASRNDLAQALLAVQRFMGARTSTVSGIKEVIEERRARIRQDMPNISKEEADAILIWLGSEEGRAAKENFESNQIKQAMAKAAHAAGATTQSDLSRLWHEHLQRNETTADWIRNLDNMESF